MVKKSIIITNICMLCTVGMIGCTSQSDNYESQETTSVVKTVDMSDIPNLQDDIGIIVNKAKYEYSNDEIHHILVVNYSDYNIQVEVSEDTYNSVEMGDQYKYIGGKWD